MKTITLIAFLTAISLTAYCQKHKATKMEADYYNKYKVLYGALPEKFRSGKMDDFGARPGDTSEGDTMDDCKSSDCYMLLATANYSFAYGNPEADGLRSQKDAIKGTDNASRQKKDLLQYKLGNEFGVSVKLMANFVSGEDFMYCKASGSYQKLAPPAGWDGWYMGSMATCPNFSGVQSADASFLFIGTLPTMKETDLKDWIKTTPTFPVNQADISQFKVKNIVLYIQGSKDLVAEFVKNMDTKSLRAMVQ